MIRDLEKDLMEIESAIKSNEERGNTFTVSVLQQAYKRLKDTQWIPCSERLPEEYRKVDNETGYYGESERVLCSAKNDETGEYEIWIDYTIEGEWQTHEWYDGEKLAWMPLPEPYGIQ